MFDGGLRVLGAPLEVVFIDLLLSGDNAIVIALACRSLPVQQRGKGILIGTVAAILLRIFSISVITYLLKIPYLELVAALALVLIAIKLILPDETTGHVDDAVVKQNRDLSSALAVIVAADVIMSLDNVVALAALAQGSMILLALGLLVSMPLLIYGSMSIGKLFKAYPGSITAGGVLLGWIAGDIAISDPAISDWVKSQAPALTIIMPLIGSIFVFLESRIIEHERGKTTAQSGACPPEPVNTERPIASWLAKQPTPNHAGSAVRAIPQHQTSGGTRSISLSSRRMGAEGLFWHWSLRILNNNVGTTMRSSALILVSILFALGVVYPVNKVLELSSLAGPSGAPARVEKLCEAHAQQSHPGSDPSTLQRLIENCLANSLPFGDREAGAEGDGFPPADRRASAEE